MLSKPMTRLLISIAAMGILLAACMPAAAAPTETNTPLPERIRLYIAPETGPCESDPAQDCLLARRSQVDRWGAIEGPIEGFAYEAGFEYELVVERQKIEETAGAGDAFQYTLVEIVQMNPVEPLSTPILLAGTRWDLVSYGPAGRLQQPPTGAEVTLNFEADQASGRAGCNFYGGSYLLEGSSLSWRDPYFTTTEMACEEPLMQLESAYLQLLSGAEHIRLEDGTLTLEGPQGLLVFEVPVSAELEGTTWILNGLAERGGIVSTWIDESIEARFENGKVAGSSGCNQFSASYELDGESLLIGPAISTKMACENEVMQRETAFLSALGEVTSFVIERQTLRLLDGQGNPALIFRSASSPAP